MVYLCITPISPPLLPPFHFLELHKASVYIKQKRKRKESKQESKKKKKILKQRSDEDLQGGKLPEVDTNIKSSVVRIPVEPFEAP